MSLDVTELLSPQLWPFTNYKSVINPVYGMITPFKTIYKHQDYQTEYMTYYYVYIYIMYGGRWTIRRLYIYSSNKRATCKQILTCWKIFQHIAMIKDEMLQTKKPLMTRAME